MGGTGTTSANPAPDLLNISDDDAFLDEPSVDPMTGFVNVDTNQVLATDLIVEGVVVGSAGSLVVADFEMTFVLTATGETITGYSVSVVDPVTGLGTFGGIVTTVVMPPNASYTWTGPIFPATVPYADLVPCFTLDTMIKCKNGPVAVQDIRAGDQVVTRDNGLQGVRWAGRRAVPGRGEMAPVLFKAGVLGNAEDFLVSPMHRVVIRGPRAEALFGEAEVLAHAAHLCDGEQIFRTPVAEVTYIHLLFDRHEIINAYGCWSESFAPSEAALRSVDARTRAEIIKLFPQLCEDWRDCLPTLSALEAQLIRDA